MPSPRLAALAALAALTLGACRTSPADTTTVDVSTGTPPADSAVIPSSPTDPDGDDAEAPDDESGNPDRDDSGAPSPGNRVLAVFPGGTIGDVDFDATGADLQRRYGRRVQVEEDAIEGTTRPKYLVDVSGATVTRVGYLVRYSDLRIRNVDNLGVGSSIGEFGAVYGNTEVTRGEEAQCDGTSFLAGSRRVRACVDRGCRNSACPVRSVEWVTDVDAASGASAPAEPPVSDEPTPADAAEVVRDYYRFIAAREYRRAYGLWAGLGEASGQSYVDFARGFDDTRTVFATVGTPGRMDPGAGQRHVVVPVTVRAIMDSGAEQRFEGTYTLRRSVVDGATAQQRAWRLADANLRLVR